MSPNRQRQIYYAFKEKCVWRPEHETQLAQNFKKKAQRLLSDMLGRELKRGTPVPQDEAFKITHVKKKANTNDPDQWCEERAERTYNQYQHSKAEFLRTQPPNTQLLEEQMEERWLESVCGPTRFGTAYGMPHRAFRQYRSPLEGLHSCNTKSFDRVSAMAIEQKIAELSRQLQTSEERERGRDMQFDDMSGIGNNQTTGNNANNEWIAPDGLPCDPTAVDLLI
ncbi:uncharacterized protein LOC132611941 [Lycium barbarum]|uniref:uncharacterized protein LOC132611941 n=1 Tax=Lycium barbarum TaxID=112863 RepID=UPI00293F70F3|nr:uncharacterized protein LOC132611941 [Lycium barbarum]